MISPTTPVSRTILEKAQTEKPWLRKVSKFRYRVTPRTNEHGKYELSLLYGPNDQPVVVNCTDVRTRETCKGFLHHGVCYHSVWLLKVLMQRIERQKAA